MEFKEAVILRDRAEVARQAHYLEDGGSIPSPATNGIMMELEDM